MKIGKRVGLMLMAMAPIIGIGQSSLSTSAPVMNVVPSSPDAAAIAKYGDIPVSLYTGIPSISLPIYTISLKGLSVPISLNYHSSGIKVDELASNVGVGWSLHFGGAITQTVNGQPDLYSTGWRNLSSPQVLPQADTLQTVWAWNTAGYDADPAYAFMQDASDDVFDTQPDIYTLNLNGRTVKFFYDQSGNRFLMPYQRLRFNSDIEIQDEKDNIFKYDTMETATTTYTHSGNADPHPVSFFQNFTYYPSKIVTPYGEEIIYEYETYNYSFANQVTGTRYVLQPGNSFCASSSIDDNVTTSVTSVQGKRVTKISTSNGIEISFFYDSTRLDLPGTKALTSVIIKSLRSNKIIASYVLQYGYYDGGGFTADRYRLKLLSLQKTGEPPHSFEYDSTAVPARLSMSQDHWGYYNGIGNTSLFPMAPAQGFFTGGIRAPSEQGKNGILTKINYPTGGYSAFEYESNQALVTDTVFQERLASCYPSVSTIVSQPFTVIAGTSFRVKFKAPAGDDIPDLNSIVIKDELGSLVFAFSGESVSPFGDAINHLVPGNYTIEMTCGADITGVYFNLQWYDIVEETGVKPVGGFRIKTMTTSSAVGQPIVKHFEYNQTRISGRPNYAYTHLQASYVSSLSAYRDCFYSAQSTASLVSLNLFGSTAVYTDVDVYTGVKQNGYTKNLFSSVGGYTGSWNYPFGPVIANDWVDGLPLEVIDYKWNGSAFVEVRKIKNEYKTIFGVDANGLPHENTVLGAKIALYKPDLPNLTPPYTRGPEFKVNYYKLNSSWSYLTKSTVTLRDQADTSRKLITETQYLYENPDHIEITRELINRSQGGKFEIYYRYPADYSTPSYNASPVVEKRVVIDEAGTKRLVSAEIIPHTTQPGPLPTAHYQLLATTALNPSSVANYSGNTIPSGYQWTDNYTYDLRANLIKQEQQGGQLQSYIWDSTGEYVIAKATNAAPNELFHDSFEDRTGWLGSGLTYDTARVHAGQIAAKVSAPSLTETSNASNKWLTISLPAPAKFRYAGWIYSDGPTADIILVMKTTGGSISTDVLTSSATGKWVFVEKEFTVPANITQLSIRIDNNGGGNVWFDDIRLHPSQARMVTYTHDPLIGMTSQADMNNRFTYYEYDALGRLILIRDHDRNILKKVTYNYNGQPEN